MTHLAVLLLGLTVSGCLPGDQGVQADRMRVLVVPLQSTQFDPEFGEKVARAVRARIDQSHYHRALSEDEFGRALVRYELARESLNAIKSRQLAHLMGARVVYWGVVKRTEPGGYAVESQFIDVRTGEQVVVPTVRVGAGGRADVERLTTTVIEVFGDGPGKLGYRTVCAEEVAQRRLLRALQTCDQALSLDSTHLDALYNKAAGAWLLYGETGEGGWADSALSYFQSALDRGRRCPLGVDYMPVGIAPACVDLLLPDDPELITSLFAAYLERNPEDVSVRLKVASDLRRIDALPEAIEVLQGGRALSPDDTTLLLTLGEYALRAAGRETADAYAPLALEAYRAVLAIDPDNWAARRGAHLVEVFVPDNRSPAEPPQDPPDQRSDAVSVLIVPLESSALDAEFGEQVARGVRARVAESPDHDTISGDELTQALARYEVRRESLNEIKARQLANLMGARLFFWGVVKQTDPADYTVESEFIDVMTGDEVVVPALRIGAGGDEAVARVVEAAADLFERTRMKVRTRILCADALTDRRLHDALEQCDEALALDPTDFNSLFNKTQALWLLHLDTDEEHYADSARTYMERVLSRPCPPRTHCLSPILTRPPDIAIYRQYLELDQHNVPVRLKVAYELMRRDSTPEAIRLLDAGRALAPNDTTLLQALGDYALKYAGQDTNYIELAVEAYRAILALDPDNPTARQGLESAIKLQEGGD